jgi:hypothetical protein
MTSFLGIGVELAKSNRSLRIDQIFILYSMFLLENSRFCKELLIERYNKVGDLNLYVVNARFHLKCLFLALKFAFPLISQNGGVTSAKPFLFYSFLFVFQQQTFVLCLQSKMIYKKEKKNRLSAKPFLFYSFLFVF